MNFKTKFKENKGITLIALVVTIIVLLILAGISINALAGQNGILNRTISAKQKTEEAQVQEELETGLMGLFMDYQVEAGGEETFADYIFANEAKVQSELGGNVGLDSTNKTITYKGTLFSVADDGKVTRKDGTEISEIGQYVEYDVAYTDMYTITEGENTFYKEYTKENGWRILSMTPSETVSEAYDIEIVSTGIPAKLYHSSSIYDKGAVWDGTEEQQEKYLKSYYGMEVGSLGLIRASGLAYNFAKVTFKGNSIESQNKGFYKKIAKNNETEVYTGDEITGNIFVAREGATVRSMMHTDVPNIANSITSLSDIQNKIEADTTGLFRLDNLGYTDSFFWLASPSTYSIAGVLDVGSDGYVGGSGYGANDCYDDAYGVRPVISMSGVTMQKTTTKEGTTLWKITN